MFCHQVQWNLLNFKQCLSFVIVHSTHFSTNHSGGSRIFPRGCANSQNCYYFSNFCWKLHENERIWTRGGASLMPPLDPPMNQVVNQWLTDYDAISFLLPWSDRYISHGHVFEFSKEAIWAIKAVSFAPSKKTSTLTVLHYHIFVLVNYKCTQWPPGDLICSTTGRIQGQR